MVVIFMYDKEFFDDLGFSEEFLKDFLKGFKERLLNSQAVHELADGLVTSLFSYLNRENNSSVNFFQPFYRGRVHEGIKTIFSQAESPIELIFLNSLLINSITTLPLFLFITSPSIHDAPKMMSIYRNYHKKVFDIWKLYKENYNDSLEGFNLFIEKLFTGNNMTSYDKECFIFHFLCHFNYPKLYNTYHISIQPKFLDFKINNKSIRPDILIWIPGDETFKLIVECDSYQYHLNKKSFVDDRKRDRLFRSKKYDVRRYTGVEITTDPIEVSLDLICYLKSFLNPNNEL
jgi:hypothetical protein